MLATRHVAAISQGRPAFRRRGQPHLKISRRSCKNPSEIPKGEKREGSPTESEGSCFRCRDASRPETRTLAYSCDGLEGGRENRGNDS